MISHLAALVSPYHAVLYHSILPMGSVVWGTLIDLAVASVLAALLFGYLQKRETGLRTLVWVFIAARIAHTIVGIVTMTFGWSIPHLTPSTRRNRNPRYRADVVVAATAGLSRGRPWITGAADTRRMQRGMDGAAARLSGLAAPAERPGRARDASRSGFGANSSQKRRTDHLASF